MQPSALERAQVEGFDDAQRRGWRLLADVAREVHVGMSEVEIEAIAHDKATAHGFDRWFHPPEVQVGARIGKSRVLRGASASARIKPGELVAIDLAPSGAEFYADVGVTLHVAEPGAAEPELLLVARECVRGCVGYSSQWKTVGEIFVFAKSWANNHRYQLASEGAIGHAILPKAGLLSLGFPASAHAAARLRRYQVHFLHPARIRGAWAFRPVVRGDGLTASFEELVYIDGDEKRILGRANLSEVGTLPGL